MSIRKNIVCINENVSIITKAIKTPEQLQTSGTRLPSHLCHRDGDFSFQHPNVLNVLIYIQTLKSKSIIYLSSDNMRGSVAGTNTSSNHQSANHGSQRIMIDMGG